MSDSWYLNKHDDGTIFGPASADQVQDWALAAKISPLDKVSSDDQATWRRAPMIPELHMDWLVEVSEDYLYGPTTFGTVQEFLAAGEIGSETIVINCKEGSQARVKDMPVFSTRLRRQHIDELVNEPGSAKPSEDQPTLSDSDHILELEGKILDLRRALHESELRYQQLRSKYTSATGDAP
jgi:hypothetical protein